MTAHPQSRQRLHCLTTQGLKQSELPQPIPWNETSDIHRGFTL